MGVASRRLRGGSSGDVDEGLYSRQLYVMGHAAQRSLSRATVLLLGLSGLGAELAKALALAGPRGLHVSDEASLQLSELSSSWLAREEGVGRRRDEGAAQRLALLNEYVQVEL
eukprot:scaffold111006_cov30-Tisochrysis_lutea.AAC.1